MLPGDPPGATDRPRAARTLLADQSQAVLATLSVRHAGWPFASLAPYALNARGEPLLALSDLAEHTRNLRADPRASLFVQDGTGQAGARLTLLGRVEPLVPGADGRADADARRRYLERHPASVVSLALADLRMYVLRITQARFIGGFGEMGWLDGADLTVPLA